MTGYHYLAKTIEGKRKTGYIRAASRDEAYKKIRTMDLYPYWVILSKRESFGKELKLSGLENFCYAMASMLKTGIPLLNTLSLLWSSEKDLKMKQFYQDLHRQMLTGVSLSAAMENQPVVCPPLLLYSVRAGEKTGNLSEILENLYDYYRRERRVKQKLTEALIYPAFLFSLTIGVVLVLFLIILPNFFELFTTMENIPWFTGMLMRFSAVIAQHTIEILLLILVGIGVIIYISRSHVFRYYFYKGLINSGTAGRAIRKINTALFAQGASILYGSGVDLMRALQLSADMISQRYVKEQVEQAIEQISDGAPLSASFAAVKGFDESLIEGLYIGEESGALSSTLKRVSEQCVNEAESMLAYLTTLIEPVMIVIVAVIVGMVMLAVMVPMLQYYENIGA